MNYIKTGITIYIALIATVGTEKAISFYIFKQKTTLEIMAKSKVYEAERDRMNLKLKYEKEKKKRCLNYIEEK